MRTKMLFILFLSIFYLFPFSSIQLTQAQIVDEQMAKELQDCEDSGEYRKFIEKYKPSEMAYTALQRLIKPYIDAKDWDTAAAILSQYKKDFPGMESRFDKTIELLKKPESKVEIKNLGENINTSKGEYLPVISADDDQLFFIRKTKTLVLRDNELYFKDDEDIFISTKTGDQWSEATAIGRPIATTSSEGVLSISADGQTLILFGNYLSPFRRGDIFYSTKTDTGWSDVNYFPAPINSPYFDADAMMTADGKAIIFVSDRPGGIGNFCKKDSMISMHGDYWGNTDIYVCVKTDSGWSEPINLGDKINTPFAERTPFLHADGKSLYFSSDGHYGLGDLDVFKATRLSDTSWTEWSEPVNLGKEYNSSGVDWGYSISTSGNVAYFSSNRSDSYGKSDIYSVELLEKPELVTTVSGKVTDPDGNPLQVNILWNDLTQNKEIGEARSDPQTGEYFIVLPAGHEYSYSASKEKYFGKSEHLDLTDKENFEEYHLDIVLYPIEELKKEETSVTIKFENIFFDIDKWDLKEKSKLELDRWVKLLSENPEITLQIEGYTDNTGTSQHNLILSRKRAEAVKNYLVQQGIDENRLMTIGFGESNPIASNETEEGRMQNRRVEARFGQLSEK